MKTISNDKQFSSTLSSVGKSAKALRDNVQSLLTYAFEHYEEHGAVSYLNRIVDSAEKTRALSTRQIKLYIKDSTNTVYGKDKAGNPTYKQGDKAKPRFTDTGETWYEYKKAAPEEKPVSLQVQLENFVKRVKSELEKAEVGELEISDVNKGTEILNGLRSLVNSVSDDKAIITE